MINARILVAGALVALGVSGCTAGTPEMLDGPWTEEFEEALEFATSDFERDVLADGVITGEEYIEAHGLWLECMLGEYPPSGPIAVKLDVNKHGLIGFSVSTTDRSELAKVEGASARCEQGTTASIAWLYNSIVTNPDNLSMEQQLLDCLAEGDSLASGYSVERFTSDLHAYEAGDPDAMPVAPGSPEFVDCMLELSTPK